MRGLSAAAQHALSTRLFGPTPSDVALDSCNNASMGADVWEPFARTNQFDRAQAQARG